MNHRITQMKPIAPVMINAACQFQVTTMAGIARGATIAPTLVPELNIPVARALSFFGNHSATVFMAAGKFPASLTPRKPLQNPKPNAPLARAWPIAAMLHNMTETPYPILVPNLSIRRPAMTMPTPYKSWKAIIMRE
jgi:hypothetical protein